MFKPITISTCSLFFCLTVLCQQKDIDFKFGNVAAKDFDVSASNIIDSSDGAVILYESGFTRFAGNNSNWFDYVFTYTKRIKIINKKAFDLATVKLSLRSNVDEASVLSNLSATTYNLENGTVSAVEMDKNSIFSEVENDNYILKKFTLPAVKEGSIIEYTYTITSPNIFNMPSWQFQNGEYPVLWSEYQVSIPVTLTYAFIKQGYDSFFINKSWEGKETYRVNKTNPNENTYTISRQLFVEANTINHRWVQKDVKPFKIESYISSPANYVDKIEFQLASTYNGAEKSDEIKTWKSVSSYFLERKDFIQALSGDDNTWIKDFRSAGATDIETAKEVYYYLQSNCTCTNANNIFTYTDLYEVYKKQKGTIRGINLLLIAMLKKNGVYAEPVILSTTSNGFINPVYPVLDQFNYLVCRALIGGQAYLLDASDPMLAFGELAPKCYNGYARIINGSRSDSLYLFADSLNDATITTLSLNNDDNGKISGSYKRTMGKISSADMRKEMLTRNSIDYFKDLKNDYSFDVNMSNTAIDSLSEREMPVAVHYDIDFKLNDDIVYFNPIPSSDIEKENPFKAAQRAYPVEMPYCTNKTYVLNMQVPAGYKVDELPKSVRVALNGDQGSFEYLVKQNNDHIQMLVRLKINKATFEPEDYETLRNFYASVVEKESEQIVFKKL